MNSIASLFRLDPLLCPCISHPRVAPPLVTYLCMRMHACALGVVFHRCEFHPGECTLRAVHAHTSHMACLVCMDGRARSSLVVTSGGLLVDTRMAAFW